MPLETNLIHLSCSQGLNCGQHMVQMVALWGTLVNGICLEKLAFASTGHSTRWGSGKSLHHKFMYLVVHVPGSLVLHMELPNEKSGRKCTEGTSWVFWTCTSQQCLRGKSLWEIYQSSHRSFMCVHLPSWQVCAHTHTERNNFLRKDEGAYQIVGRILTVRYVEDDFGWACQGDGGYNSEQHMGAEGNHFIDSPKCQACFVIAPPFSLLVC